MKKSIIATGIIATLLLLAFPAIGTAQTNTDTYIDISTTVEREVTPNELYLQITIREKEYKGKKTLEHMQEAMLGAVMVKANIVKEDEREGGVRRLLNLGHTLGHAIEKCTHEVNHGEAVAIGMSLVAHAAVRCGMLGADVAERIDRVLMQLGLSLELPVSITDVLREVKYDKKKKDNSIRLIVPTKIGECVVKELSFEELEQLFK